MVLRLQLYMWSVYETIGDMIMAPDAATVSSLNVRLNYACGNLTQAENELIQGAGFTSSLATSATEVHCTMFR